VYFELIDLCVFILYRSDIPYSVGTWTFLCNPTP